MLNLNTDEIDKVKEPVSAASPVTQNLYSLPGMKVVPDAVISKFSALVKKHAVSEEILLTTATYEYKVLFQDVG